MKDDFGGVIITEFVGLKSKMYSIKKIDGKEHNIAKGVSIATEVIFIKIVSQVVIIKKIVIIEKDWDYFILLMIIDNYY